MAKRSQPFQAERSSASGGGWVGGETKPAANPWETRGQPAANLWETRGKLVGNPWETRGKIGLGVWGLMRNPWSFSEFLRRVRWETQGKPKEDESCPLEEASHRPLCHDWYEGYLLGLSDQRKTRPPPPAPVQLKTSVQVSDGCTATITSQSSQPTMGNLPPGGSSAYHMNQPFWESV